MRPMQDPPVYRGVFGVHVVGPARTRAHPRTTALPARFRPAATRPLGRTLPPGRGSHADPQLSRDAAGFTRNGSATAERNGGYRHLGREGVPVSRKIPPAADELHERALAHRRHLLAPPAEAAIAAAGATLPIFHGSSHHLELAAAASGCCPRTLPVRRAGAGVDRAVPVGLFLDA